MTNDGIHALTVAGAVYALGGFLAAAGGVPVGPIIVAAIACMMGAVVTLALRAADPVWMSYAIVVIIVSAAWLAYTTVAGSPWTAAAAYSWAVGTILLAPVYVGLRVRQARHAEQRAAQAEHAKLRRREGEWVALWARAGVRGLTETGREETRAGLKIHMHLPEDGKVTLDSMQRAVPKVEIAHGALRRGAIRVEAGVLAHEVIVHVNAIDVLAQTIPVPDDVTPCTGDQPLDIGRYEDGAGTLLPLDKHVQVIGVTDAGKSNLLNAIIKEGARRVDTLIWVIDPKGGRLVTPWLQAWLDGYADRPIIDWVATQPQEWDRMLDDAIRIMDARANAQLGGEKVIASPTCPRILLIIDEVADVTASRKTAEKIKRLTRKGRSEEIKLVIAGQRGTVTMFVDGDTKSQIGSTIGLGVTRTADGQAIFPDDVRVAQSLARMQHPGCMIVKAGESRPLPAKAYRITYDQIPRYASLLAELRPGLDELSAAACRSYADRWEWDRCGHLIGARPSPSSGGQTPPAEPGRPSEAEAFASLTAQLGPAIPPILSVVEDIFEQLGTDRLHTKTLLDRLPAGIGEMTGKRLSMLLGTLGVTPCEPFEVDGVRARGYRRADLAAARARVEAGEVAVPDWVHAWPGQPVS